MAPLIVIQASFDVLPEYVNIGALYVFFSPVEIKVLDRILLFVNNAVSVTSLCSCMFTLDDIFLGGTW